jgi:hypothetical protein
MANGSSTISEYGLGKFRVISKQVMDFFVDCILRRTEAQGGSLSANDIRKELQRFKADPGEDTTPFFNDAWRECTFSVERLRWDKEGRYSFERLIVNTFMHLLPTSDHILVQREHLSHRIIPVFVIAIQQMLGQKLSDKHEDLYRAMVSRMQVQHCNEFN